MPLQFWFRLTGACAVAILAAALFFAWRAERHDRAQLGADLARTQQALSEATARQVDRDQQLAKLLASLEERKLTVVTPAQIIQQLPRELPLPIPLAMTPVGNGSSTSPKSARSPNDAVANLPPVVLPAADLKPLYDFALDCHSCQARLTAATNDLADERIKSSALGRERDSALRVARGGSVWRRVGRAAKWFVIGAAAGAVAARVTH